MKETNTENKTEVVRLKTTKDIRAKFGYSIRKGSEVDVHIETKNGKTTYSVAYPGSTSLFIAVKKTCFELPVKTEEEPKHNLKVGDEFWFFSTKSKTIWKDKITKITSKHAFFSNHDSCKGQYKLELWTFKYDISGVIMINIVQDIKFPFREDFISFSKKKKDILKESLKMIETEKIKKANSLESVSREYHKGIKEFQLLETQEQDILREIKKCQ